MSYWNTAYPYEFTNPIYYVPFSIRFSNSMSNEWVESWKYNYIEDNLNRYNAIGIQKNTGDDIHFFILWNDKLIPPVTPTITQATLRVVASSKSPFSFNYNRIDENNPNYDDNPTTVYSDSTYTYNSEKVYYVTRDIGFSFDKTTGISTINENFVTHMNDAQITSVTEKVNYFAWLMWNDAIYTNDPYNRPPQGDAPRGGNGNWDNTSDTIEVDPLPAGLWGQGFVSVYVPTVAELASFASEIWDADNRTLFNDIFPQGVSSGIIDCFTIPVQPDTTTGANICMGGEVIANTHSAILANRFKTVDFGNITGGNIGEHFGAFPDYMSTKIAIYLPYIGWEELAPEMVINASINLQYKIDCLTGDFVAIITTTRHDDKFDFEGISYTFNGNCASKIPITSQTGAGAHDYVSSAISGLTTIAGGAMTGNPIAVAGGTVNMVNSMLAMNDKHTFSLKGGFTGSKGQLSPQRPYLVINRPVMENGANNNYFNLCGAPSNDFVSLSACVGESPALTKVFECVIDDNNFANATEQEKNKIYNLLKSGVIL